MLFPWGITFFSDKSALRKFPSPSFARGIQEISVRRLDFSLYILHPYKHSIKFYKQKTLAAARGAPCFMNGELPKKLMLA